MHMVDGVRVNQMITQLKWPKKVEQNPKSASLDEMVQKKKVLLWPEGTMEIVQTGFGPELEKVLVRTLSLKHLEKGLERAEQILDLEKRGLEMTREKTGAGPAARVSRLILVTNDGAERFYRSCEKVGTKHADRLMIIRLEMGSEDLGQKLYGPGKPVKALLVSDRESVVQVLLALV